MLGRVYCAMPIPPFLLAPTSSGIGHLHWALGIGHWALNLRPRGQSVKKLRIQDLTPWLTPASYRADDSPFRMLKLETLE